MELHSALLSILTKCEFGDIVDDIVPIVENDVAADSFIVWMCFVGQ